MAGVSNPARVSDSHPAAGTIPLLRGRLYQWLLFEPGSVHRFFPSSRCGGPVLILMRGVTAFVRLGMIRPGDNRDGYPNRNLTPKLTKELRNGHIRDF